MTENNERNKLLAIIKRLDDRIKLLEERERNSAEQNDKSQESFEESSPDKYVPPTLRELDEIMYKSNHPDVFRSGKIKNEIVRS